MMRGEPLRLLPALPVLLFAAVGLAAGAARSVDINSLRGTVFASYRAEKYDEAAEAAAQYLEAAREQGRTGREYAAVAFILGHSRYELHRRNGEPYDGDYRGDVVEPIELSLRVLQDDPAFKNMLLANAYYELWVQKGRRDADAERQAQWHLLKSILLRQSAVRNSPKDSEEYDLFARHLLFYLERCLDLSRDSASPDIYAQRIRSVAPWGLATAYDARFGQIFDLTYFDGGNMKAAALWQAGLDAMQDPDATVDDVLSYFGGAADLTRTPVDRAEVYRQMADFVSTIDEPERRTQAADFARKAYDLDPASAGIRRQFGSSLHLLSYAAYTLGRFDEALRHAEEAVAFEWEGNEVAYFDVSRAAAELGRETDAMTNGERAYRMAKRVNGETGLQPFAQNYVNILRQFGQHGLADRILREEPSLGVR